MPREASRPAKFPYIPPAQRLPIDAPWELEQGVRTRSIKVASRSDIKDNAVYCEQNPSTVLTIKRGKGLWCKRLEQDRWWMGLGHP